MFEVSFIPSLRRSGNEGEQTLMLRAASSYYMPEGRFYEAPVVLKQKKRKSRVLPVFLGASLSALAATTIHKTDFSHAVLSYKAAFVDNAENGAGEVVASLGQANASTIAQSHNERALEDEQRKADNHLQGNNTEQKSTHVDEVEANSRQDLSNNLFQSLASEFPTFSMTVTPFPEKFRQVGVFEVARNVETGNEKPKSVGGNSEKIENKSETKIALVVPQKKPVSKLPVPKILKNLVTNDNPDVLALGYAPANAKVDTSAFDSVLTEKQNSPIDRNGRFIPPIGRNDHAWAATPLPPEAFTAKEQKCLAEAVYFESRGESIKGQAAVAQVVLNRVRNPAYPKTICGVVYQNTNWINHCQFSFACDGRKHRVTEMAQWTVAQQVARAVTAGQIWFPEVGSATHYHAVYVRPRWARTMIKVDKIGLHIFYRTRYGGWI
ncbi:cell wall hydrolase [Bartonella apis]|uniref:cell wall hydrolase n=1 Tax=Bartonella apis TaxID=1686310 RepID=UPI00351C43BF